ncbi:AAA family ATPase [Rufibacter glacialis]|uniref:AAA family ATPase n=1 Tax=Rufibacter glacialis TaxID=1259555 RepID=A0A5M8QIW9_9BACT|nr:AAA family ATPase [Rufibacter glacialis]KAA6434713.1 ATP-binding protein [Rufibacter glacialis]GGK71830.1 ATP-binding protein [Rufibacter glacialis]
MNLEIKRFRILGLHYYQDFDIVFDESIKILVGENGLGKTTVLNALYYTLTMRWHILEDIGFDFIELYINDQIIEFSHSDLENYLIVKKGFLKSTHSHEQFASLGEYIHKFILFEEILENISHKIVYFPVNRNIENQMETFGLGLHTIINSEVKARKRKKGTHNEDFEALIERMSILKDTIIKLNMEDVERMFADSKASISLMEHFINVCNQYLVTTEFYINKNRIDLEVRNKKTKEEVSLRQLSSGEKQIVYIFTKIFLSRQDDLIVLFDEPELSLSMLWQKKLLVDIVNSKKCSFLFAVTHSPFVFKNELDKYAIGMNVYID